jgi:hypothetical protein
MTGTQEVEHREDYLHISDSLTLDTNTLENFLNDLLITCKESSHLKILVDLSHAPIKLKFLDYHSGGEIFAKLFVGFKVAFVFTEIKENYIFGKTVALNRGARVSLFASIEEASTWLLE